MVEPHEDIDAGDPAVCDHAGFDGGACPAGGVPPFAPQVLAGTEDNAAGSYSPFDLRITPQGRRTGDHGVRLAVPARADRQPLRGRVVLGSGRRGGPCQTGVPAGSRTLVPAGERNRIYDRRSGRRLGARAGAGQDYSVEDSKGRRSRSWRSPRAHVGPFDLGTVVVHLPLDINPETAAVSIPAGPADQIPHIIKGIVIHVREIHAYINRQKFMLNPTNCTPLTLLHNRDRLGSQTSPTRPMTRRSQRSLRSRPLTARTLASNRPSRSRPPARPRAKTAPASTSSWPTRAARLGRRRTSAQSRLTYPGSYPRA